MTLLEAPFWVWGVIALNSSLFLLASLSPLLLLWHQENQARLKPQPVPLLVETRRA
jgi:hypothetical protein